MSGAETPVDKARRAGLSALALVGSAVGGTIVCRIESGNWVPPPAFLQAIVYGGVNAMFAIGLVLVYRASRIVNFAQGILGVIGATLFLMLVVVKGWNFFFALPVSVAASAAVGLVVEVSLVRRLAKAPRLALTVVTIGLGQVLLAAAGILPIFFLRDVTELPTGGLRTPFSTFEWRASPLIFTGNHVLVVVVSLAVMGGLALFFRLSSVGIAVRGAAENDDRAALLGINTSNLSTFVWVLAATLSGLAAILNLTIQPTIFGVAAVGGASASVLLRALGAAVVGRMENLPITVAAAMGIAIFERCMFWAFDNTAMMDMALLILIVVVLLVQRSQSSRTDEGTTGTWAASVEVRPVPKELRDIPTVRAGLRRSLVVLGLVVAAFPWVMSPSQTSQGTVFVIYGIVVISLVVLTGWGGQISLGQFAFVAIGAVVGSSLTSRAGWPFLIALIAASLIGAAMAVAVGLPAMRITGLFLAVTTLAFAVAVTSVVLNPRFFGWLLPGSITRPKFLFLDSEDPRVYYYLCVAALLFALWVASGIRKSRAGRVLIAMRENERTAQAFAVNRVRTRLATFAISGFLASFAGVLLAHQQYSVRQTAFLPEHSVQIFLIAIIGGLGSVPGALTGVLYIALVNIFVSGNFGQLLASGMGVMLILLFYPSGLGGLVFAGRDAWLRRVAMRQGIYVPSLMGNYRVMEGDMARATLAPKFASSTVGTSADAGAEQERDVVPVRYRIPSAIGVRGESQQGHAWRWQG
ncbi:MAG TPA: ABC transporter permease [Acidimicrobiales bacterium]|nr:ABC transporter permease [Acidimicrobiales bacterium]